MRHLLFGEQRHCSSEMLSSPVKRIDEILALHYPVDDFKGQIRDKIRWNFMIEA
ncbi:Hypothetical predicted protein [Olea europaea subsp. europaea]|uniref:Uncharacterized protein n=1 Tax=Olea europaea subsp. europaea TaxID=158383 RepID=A0A8S0UBR2_OLEEU|nr:Hypothetical predicted protein [Olea europaea subsp. europaea]